ncbi:MAG: hypothetical protein WD053_10940 [Gracilimonas sp.]
MNAEVFLLILLILQIMVQNDALTNALMPWPPSNFLRRLLPCVRGEKKWGCELGLLGFFRQSTHIMLPLSFLPTKETKTLVYENNAKTGSITLKEINAP